MAKSQKVKAHNTGSHTHNSGHRSAGAEQSEEQAYSPENESHETEEKKDDTAQAHGSDAAEGVKPTGEKKKKAKEADIDIEIDGEAVPEISDVKNDSGIDALEKQLAEQKNKYLRLAAEYDNFRKRSKQEKEATYQQARADAITGLLPIYDNLERALKMQCSDEAFYKGIEMTMMSLNDIFQSMDIRSIPAIGESFDPNRHNAVLSIENPELGEKIIAEECQKGFMLGERVIRHSTVVVAN